jgi:hypothetical protein
MDNLMNNIIPSQFPLLYKDRGPNFIAFVKAYYEWLESENNPLWYARNFSNFVDIDNTLEQFIIHFKNKYMDSLPINIIANQRLLIKHITDLYNAKGSKRGYQLLFRILFNEDIDFYIPSSDIFKLSDNIWVEEGYIELTDCDYITDLIENSIYGSSSGASALVENFNIISIQNKVINVLHLSNIKGEFKYGEQILSYDVPNITTDNAPLVIGSLTSISLENGGINFNIGDVVNIVGSGAGALGRVSSVRYDRGKILFNLVDGGYGYTINPNITISGGSGSGATFSVGGITNQIIYAVNLDLLQDYYNTILDNQGYNLSISNSTGTFTIGEVVNTSINTISLDFSFLSGNNLVQSESLSNSSLGITNLIISYIDNPSFVTVTGTETQLLNANIVSHIQLISNTSNSIIVINSIIPKSQTIGVGTVSVSNSTFVTLINANGYFSPLGTLTGNTSHYTAYINTTIRNTNWGFPVAGTSNLDTPMNNYLNNQNLEIGKISRLIKENPGEFYSSNVNISIIEPAIEQLKIDDGAGNIWGNNAIVTGTASNANGIVTSIQIIDSGFGFDPNEELSLSSNNNNYSAFGYAVVSGTGRSKGYWKNSKSFLSNRNKLQDSFYYQNFSYEIIAPRMLETYDKFVKDILHPVGYQMFGKFRINDLQKNISGLSNATTKLYSNSVLISIS